MVRKVVSLPPATVTRPWPASSTRCRRDTVEARPSALRTSGRIPAEVEMRSAGVSRAPGKARFTVRRR